MQLKIRKLKINRLVKRFILLAAAISICGFSYLLYREIRFPAAAEQQEQFYHYIGKPSVSYSIILAPNNIYEGPSLEEGRYYLTKCTDSIQADFMYELTGDRPASMEGFYEISALVVGYTTMEETRVTIWEKKFTIKPRTEILVTDRKLKLSESISIPLEKYNDFYAEVSEFTKVTTPVQLKVVMDVSLRAQVSGRQVEIKDSPGITLPLDEEYFKISKLGTEEKQGSITETRKVQIPPDRMKTTIYLMGLGIAVLLVPGLCIFTEGKGRNRFARQLGKIFRTHGSRMVALNSGLMAVSSDNCSVVRSIDDLVRISDEIGRPIMYEFSEGNSETMQFFVLDGRRTYMYALKNDPANTGIDIADRRNAAL